MTAERVTALIDAAVQHGLVSRAGPSALPSPRHLLYAEAVEAEVTAQTRSMLHRRIARTLPIRLRPARRPHLALERAGSLARALRCWYLAGQAAANHHAHAEAAQFYAACPEAAIADGTLVKVRAYTDLNGEVTVLINPSARLWSTWPSDRSSGCNPGCPADPP
jgi:hypothetical protein